MYFNEILWERYLKTTKNPQNPQKFVENVKKLLDEVQNQRNFEDTLYQIDKLLENMTENEQEEAGKLIDELMKP